MTGANGRRGAGVRLRGEGGFSMVELTVALAAAVIIGFGLYAIFNAQRRASIAQKTYNDLQTSCSFAMDTMKNDLLLAGYRAKNAVEPISGAATNAITFEYWDDHATTDAPYDTGYENYTQVTYSLSGTNLQKTIRRWHTATNAYSTPTTFTLARNIPQLLLNYFKADNQPLTAPVSPSELKDIRNVLVSLKCEAARTNVVYTDATRATPSTVRQQITLTAEIKPRNIAISSTAQDTTGPGQVQNVRVWDEGECGCLRLRWDALGDGDLDGYTVYVGLAPGNYTRRERLSASHSGGYQYHTLRRLPDTGVPYYIAVAGYDKSGNPSVSLSAAASGNPSPSVRTEGGGNDSAINPQAPPAPGAFAVVPPTGVDNQLLLTWTKTYSDCRQPSVAGYRIYRSTNPSFIPSGTQAGQGNCIADETTLNADALTFTDPGLYTAAGTLVGCVTYHYKVALVHCDANRLNNYPTETGDTAYTVSQFASASGVPTDGTAPRAPVLLAKAGYRRIILTLTNTTRDVDPDFTFTRVYFSTSGYPYLDTAGTVIDPGNGSPARTIPDDGGQFPQGGGPIVRNFDDETYPVPPGGLGSPQLLPDQTYYFLAVSYDICGNHTQDTDTSAKALATQCQDCLDTEVCRDAPPPPENVRVTEGCDGHVRVDWDYAASNYITHYDFQGFRVLRREGATWATGTAEVNLTGTYLSSAQYLVDDTLDEGKVYSYRIEAGDCYYQRHLEGLLSPSEIAANDPGDNFSSTDKEGVAVGLLDRARVSAQQATTLTRDHDAVETTFEVVSTAGFTTQKVQIGSEVAEYHGTTTTSFTGCLRGAEGTVAIPHLAGASVLAWPPPPTTAAVTGDLTLSPPTFRHNTVTFGARNSSADRLTLRQLSLSWDDPEAYFQKMVIGDGNTTPVATAYDETGSPLTVPSTGGTVTLANPQIYALDDRIPLQLTFLHADRSLARSPSQPAVDLREDELRLAWTYRNDATQIEGCGLDWVTQGPGTLLAPLGPVVAGTTQSSPLAGTVSWPVPGDTGTNVMNAVVVPGGTDVTVSTVVRDVSGTGLASVRLYYYADYSRVYNAAPDVSGSYPSCSPYAMLEMTNVAGSLWSAAIPARDNSNVWFFVVAVDNEGNFDREPEIDSGAFQYFQQAGDVCNNTPLPPVLGGSSTSTSVTLTWTAPTQNTDGSAAGDLRGFKVFRQIGQRGWVLEATVPDPFATSWTQTVTPVATALRLTIDAAVTTVPVNNTAGFLPSGTVLIGTELIRYTGTTGTSFTGCTRGYGGTLPAAHALGSTVTQNVLQTEDNFYYVTAYDACEPTPRESAASNIWVECEGAPPCILIVTPQRTPLQAGDRFAIDLTLCGQAGGGRSTVYAQTCSQSGGDADPIRMFEEAADNGIFHVDAAYYGRSDLRTYLPANYPASPIDLDLLVNATDTITVGAWASNTNPGGVNWDSTCQGSGYSCGAPVTLAVAAPPPDICTSDHTPSAPASLTVTPVGNCNSTNDVSLSWPAVTPPDPGYSSFGYQILYCDAGAAASCTPSTLIAVSPTCTAGTCTSGTLTMPTKLADVGQTRHHYFFGVRAVYDLNASRCPPGGRRWTSPMATRDETCN